MDTKKKYTWKLKRTYNLQLAQSSRSSLTSPRYTFSAIDVEVAGYAGQGTAVLMSPQKQLKVGHGRRKHITTHSHTS